MPAALTFRSADESLPERAHDRARKPRLGWRFRDDTGFWEDISWNLPGHRPNKLQPLMPSWVERETPERYLIDLNAQRDWLARSAASRDEAVKKEPPAECHSLSG